MKYSIIKRPQIFVKSVVAFLSPWPKKAVKRKTDRNPSWTERKEAKLLK